MPKTHSALLLYLLKCSILYTEELKQIHSCTQYTMYVVLWLCQTITDTVQLNHKYMSKDAFKIL